MILGLRFDLVFVSKVTVHRQINRQATASESKTFYYNTFNLNQSNGMKKKDYFSFTLFVT